MEGDRTSRTATILVVLVFVLGLAIGSLGTYLAEGRLVSAQHRVNMHDRVMQRLTSELSLTADQQKQLDAILVGIQGRHEAMMKQMAPQLDQLRQQGRDEIRAILTSDQKTKYEEYLRKADEERKRNSSH